MAFPYLDDPPASEGRTGVITGGYETRAGEAVWLVAWDDRKKTAPESVTADGDFADGQRVQLVRGSLVRLAQ